MVTFGGQAERRQEDRRRKERRQAERIRLKEWYWVYRSLEPKKPRFKFGRKDG